MPVCVGGLARQAGVARVLRHVANDAVEVNGAIAFASCNADPLPSLRRPSANSSAKLRVPDTILSGGEKARLEVLILELEGHNLLHGSSSQMMATPDELSTELANEYGGASSYLH